MKKELIAQRDPKSPISEVFRTLRTNIQFMNTGKKLQVIQVASTFPGEGKTYISSNLAVTFAQAGKRVILIDADMRKGRLFSVFEVSPKPGLSNYLCGMDSDRDGNVDISRYIKRTEIDNLLLIPAGNVPPNPSELLVSQRMSKLLEDLKEVCDLIIIDGTPCALVADSVILSRIVDTTVIVTACKETKKDNLNNVAKNIRNVGGKIAGIVINKIPISPKKYGESYYYGYSPATTAMPKRKTKAMEAREKSEQVRNRAIASIAQNTPKIEEPERKINKENAGEKNEKRTILEKDSLPRPDFSKNEKENKKEYRDTSIKKSNDILSQINTYLENEKKDLK